MRLRWIAFSGVVLVIVGLSGCTDDSESPPPATDAAGTPGPYTLADGAPALCGEFTDATPLSDVPTAVAALAADPADAAAQQAVQAASDKARAIADLADQDGAHPDIAQAATDLAGVLGSTTGQPLTEDTLTSLSTLLDALGELVQPVCELPT